MTIITKELLTQDAYICFDMFVKLLHKNPLFDLKKLSKKIINTRRKKEKKKKITCN
jgi:hypothetical protein